MIDPTEAEQCAKCERRGQDKRGNGRLAALAATAWQRSEGAAFHQGTPAAVGGGERT